MKTIIAAVLATALSTSAFAQGAGTGNPVVLPGAIPSGAPGVATPQAGSTGAPDAGNYSPSGQPADVISNDSAAASNANQPSRVAPQGGGGGK